MLSGAAWQNVKAADAIAPAGRLFPTHSDNFVMGEPVEETENMKRVRGYCQQLAQLLMDIHVLCNSASSHHANAPAMVRAPSASTCAILVAIAGLI